MLRAHKVPCTQLNSEAKISLSAHGTPPMFKYHCTVRAGMLASCATLLSAPAYSQLPSISLPSVSIPTLDDLRRNIIPTPPVLPQEIERIIPPQFREAVRQPTAVLQGTIDEATRKAVGHLQKMADDAKNDGNAMAETTIRQAITVIQNTAAQTRQDIINVLNSANKTFSNAAWNLTKSANDTVDAAQTIGRFAERQIAGMGALFSETQQRFAEGKVVDALWHLSTQPMTDAARNGLTATQENEILNAAAAAAATASGGPAGAAALAAAQAYNASNGNIDLALRAGAMSYLSSAAIPNVAAMPTETLRATAKKQRFPVPLRESPSLLPAETLTLLPKHSCKPAPALLFNQPKPM